MLTLAATLLGPLLIFGQEALQPPYDSIRSDDELQKLTKLLEFGTASECRQAAAEIERNRKAAKMAG